MKSLKLLLVAFISTAMFVACGNSGGGSAPGYPTYPTVPGSGSGGTGDNGDVVESIYGEARIRASRAAEYMYGEMLPFKMDIASGIFSVGSSWGQVPSGCNEFSYFKNACSGYVYGARIAQTCYVSGIYGGPQDCETYDNDTIGVWVEKKTDGKLRVRLLARARSWTTYGSTYMATLTFDDIDPDDTRYVQSLNSGRGMRIFLRGTDLSAAFNKYIRIDIEDVASTTDEYGYSDADVYYGTAQNQELIVSPRMRLKTF